ncbi:Zinc finger HIT domain-containing protein 1 [Haplosporangium sp. Z 27]|nr:Zinc finger HIT domain-containing protein 1 [Haplosporangium sp. Z 27]
MSRKPDRGVKTAPKVLDPEARRRQLRHHLDSLERDNFVALNEYEAIIATAAAAATAQGPISLTHTNLDPLGLLPPLSPAVGSIVGGVVGTVGPGAVNNLGVKPTGALSGSRYKKSQLGTSQSGSSIQNINAGAGGSGSYSGSTSALLGHKKPVLPRKPLNQLLDESGLLNTPSTTPTYLTVAMGPSRYPDRQFCSVCGWKGVYRCSRCGMRYCDLRCLKTHEDTRCMKFTI